VHILRECGALRCRSPLTRPCFIPLSSLRDAGYNAILVGEKLVELAEDKTFGSNPYQSSCKPCFLFLLSIERARSPSRPLPSAIRVPHSVPHNSRAISIDNGARGLIKAFVSKGSTKYGRPGMGAFYGRGEGAKESLGEIML